MPPTSTAARAGGFDATLQRARRVQAGEITRRVDIYTILLNIACFAKNAFFLFLIGPACSLFGAGLLVKSKGKEDDPRKLEQRTKQIQYGGLLASAIQLLSIELHRRSKYHRLHVHDPLLRQVLAGGNRVRVPATTHLPAALCPAHFPFIDSPEFRRVKTPDVYGQ
jgi:hypothetical protein